MKKSLLGIGAAGLAAVTLLSGCGTTSDGMPLAEQVKKAEAVVANARGLENHDKQADKYLLPNLYLDQTKVLYINWAATATDMIGLRFGEADVVSVIRDSTDAANLKLWDAMRNADTDPEAAKAAAAELKKFIVESYAKNKTTSKFTDDQIFETVVGKMAQEDYIAYKNAVNSKEATEDDFKGQMAWLNTGKANAEKVAAEQKKLLEATEKRLADAEKEADETKRKIELTIKYYSSKAAFLLADTQAKEAGNVLLKTGFEATAGKMKELMDEAEKEFPNVVTVFEMPPVKLATVQDAMDTKAAIEKELEPWQYAATVGGKRWSSYWEVKEWASEAQKTLEAVSGE